MVKKIYFSWHILHHYIFRVKGCRGIKCHSKAQYLVRKHFAYFHRHYLQTRPKQE